ncbi:MAG: carboxypeptidase-like regulatory domain-containing protein, partial [Campylobacterota bacterium]|nr:carboxypeptidase-like regulatory domain-containing protein [Campylobacterota bacterium]
GESGLIVNASKFTGVLSGVVLTSDKNQPIQNARIFVKGTSIDAKTDENGKFSVTIPANTNVSISIVHSEYSAETITKIKVAKDETLSREVKLTPASMELEEFIVLAPKIEGSVTALITEVKESNSISNIIGSEQMSKQGDSNAASALKRVAGITIMGGKYIYVRGLGDRYSATELNNMSLPSPNPIKRTVPLDMFPSGVIGSLQVQKTASADITGAFGGGYVNIRTKEKFNNDYAKIKLGIEAHSSLGENTITAQGGGSDWSGKDDGYRAFENSFVSSITPQVGGIDPKSVALPDNTKMQEIISQRSYNHQNSSVPLGTSVGLEFAKKIELADEHDLYILGGYGYKTKSKNIIYTDYDYITSRTGEQEDEPDNTVETARNVNSIQHGGMLNIGYNYKSLDLKFLKLYVLNTLDQSRFAEGTFGENNSDEQQTYFEWQERELDTNQLSGGFDYKVVVPNRFDFGVEYATANEYVPNDVYYNYKKNTLPDAEYAFMRNQSELTFLNRTTDDELTNYYLKNRTDIPLLSDKDYLEIGMTTESKTRESRINRVQMKSSLRDQDITTGAIDGIVNSENPDDDLQFNLLSLPKESFDASLDKNAYYLKSLIKPSEESDLTLGVRYIDLTQTIHQFDTLDNIVVTEDNALSFQKTLPSVAFKYAFNKSNQFKVAYSETFVYPDFREFSNTEFIHPVFIAKVAGNPDLIETDIQSLDFQYGYYFNDTDNITASLFYKHMDNPIEDVRAFSTSTLDKFSFENSSEADLAGVELSWYKKLDFMHEYAKNFIFFGNYTYIDSTVTLTEEQKTKFVTSERGLQGLSPQVINLALSYQEKKRSLNISYNKMSERLMRVALKNGDVILGLDDYEEPPHLLDFTWIEKFRWDSIGSDIDMTFKVKNILDGETTWRQKDKTTLKYKTGSSYSLSFSAKI